MTRKHFNAIAADLNAQYKCGNNTVRIAIIDLAYDLCVNFAQYNLQFNKRKFLNAVKAD